MNTHARRKAAKVQIKHIKMTPAELYESCDVVVRALPNDPNWTHIAANEDGRAAIEALFPETIFQWRDHPEDRYPIGWLQSSINLPDAVAHTPHRLPPITGGAPLDEAMPEALAFLLAIGATDQGARACHWSGDDGRPHIYMPPGTKISELDNVERLAVERCVDKMIDWLLGFDGTEAALKAHLDEMRAGYGDTVVELALETLVPTMQALGKRISQ